MLICIISTKLIIMSVHIAYRICERRSNMSKARYPRGWFRFYSLESPACVNTQSYESVRTRELLKRNFISLNRVESCQ